MSNTNSNPSPQDVRFAKTALRCRTEAAHLDANAIKTGADMAAHLLQVGSHEDSVNAGVRVAVAKHYGWWSFAKVSIIVASALVILWGFSAAIANAASGDTFTYLPYVGRSRPEPTVCPRICEPPTPVYVPPTRRPTGTPIATATPFINEPPQPASVNWSSKGG